MVDEGEICSVPSHRACFLDAKLSLSANFSSVLANKDV